MRPEEYRAKQDWLRSNPTGMRARSIKLKLRAWQRELDEQATTVEAWLATNRVRLGLTPWFAGYHNGRLASAVRHHDRYCGAVTDHYSNERCARRLRPRWKSCRRAGIAQTAGHRNDRAVVTGTDDQCNPQRSFPFRAKRFHRAA